MIRPVEVQGVIQRVQDISNINHTQENKPHLDQSNIQTQFKKELVMEHEQVTKKENAEYHNSKFDAKEKGKNEYHKRNDKRNKKKDNIDGEVIAKKKGGFDVKI